MQDWQAVRQKQIDFFKEGHTLPIEARKEQLKSMRRLLKENEKELSEALRLDFNKSAFECFLTEINPLFHSIQEALENIYAWSSPRGIALDQRIHFWSRAKVASQPKGNALIFAPWNYPINLVFHPMVAALAAGCTVLIKPSENVPHTSRLIQKLCSIYFPEEWVYCVLGEVDTAKELLKESWDHIFFTGSTPVGKSVMIAAAQTLSPVTLELGGKCPVVIHKNANLKIAVKRIAWAKILNAGQTCVAPDHIWVDKSILSDLLPLLKKELKKQFSSLIQEGTACSLVDRKAFDRMKGLLSDLEHEKLGEIQEESLHFPPTIVLDPSKDARLMKEEIFGPILPIFSFEDESEVRESIERLGHPLAIYLFGHSKRELRVWQNKTRSGAIVLNELIMQLASEHLPFGGIGNSGMGQYHGKAGFDTFSFQRTILSKISWLELPIRYAPYGSKLKWIKKLI